MKREGKYCSYADLAHVNLPVPRMLKCTRWTVRVPNQRYQHLWITEVIKWNHKVWFSCKPDRVRTREILHIHCGFVNRGMTVGAVGECDDPSATHSPESRAPARRKNQGCSARGFAGALCWR